MLCMYACQVSSVMSDSLRPDGLYPAKLLCPWHSLGKNTGVGCHDLIQGIFLTQGSNPRLLIPPGIKPTSRNASCIGRRVLYH